MDNFSKKLERLAERVMSRSQDPVVADMFTELSQETEWIEINAVAHKAAFIQNLAECRRLRNNITNLIDKKRRLHNG